MDHAGGRTTDQGTTPFAAAAEASLDAILAVDGTGRVTSWNVGAQALFGPTEEAAVGTALLDLFPAGRHAEVESLLARVRQGTRLPPRDTKARRGDGREVDVALSATVIDDPGGGEPGLVLVIRDVTERKLAEREAHLRLVESQRHQRALEAIGEIRLALLAGGDLGDSLRLIARLALELAGAAGVVVMVPAGDELGLDLVACEGELVEGLTGPGVGAAGSVAACVLAEGRTHTLDGPDPGRLAPGVTGPVLYLPMVGPDGPLGVLCIARHEGQRLFDAEETRLLGAFAQQAALALTLASGRRDREQLTLVADRERIARDLHDHVIQRLFAVGMSLEVARGAVTEPTAAARLASAVDELDDTIRQIRSVIFSLEVRAQHPTPSGVRQRIMEVAEQAAAALGFKPRLAFEGPLEARVPEALVSDLLAVVRETLSNAARHAACSVVEVTVEARDDLVVTVADNGRGIGNPTRSSGLANLRSRAEARGGKLAVDRPPSGGTCLEWRVPLAV